MSNLPTRHHFVPQFILRGFSVPGNEGFVCVYYPNEAPVLRPILQAAAENNLYTFRTDTGERNVDLELIWGQLETRAAPAVARLANRKLVGIDDRGVLAQYIALQLVRTPTFRDAINEHYGHMSQREIAEYSMTLGKGWVPEGFDITSVESKPLKKNDRQSFFLMKMAHEWKEKWQAVAGRQWRILHAKGSRKFIASSTGFGIDRFNGAETVKWQDPDAFIFVPLHPDFAIELTGEPLYSNIKQVAHADVPSCEVLGINGAIAFTSDDFVIANSERLNLPAGWGRGGLKITN